VTRRPYGIVDDDEDENGNRVDPGENGNRVDLGEN